MSSISKLSDECQKCTYKDDCNNKRIMACALAKTKKYNSIPNKAVGVINQLNKQVAINITAEITKEQLKKQLRINACSFNK